MLNRSRGKFNKILQLLAVNKRLPLFTSTYPTQNAPPFDIQSLTFFFFFCIPIIVWLVFFLQLLIMHSTHSVYFYSLCFPMLASRAVALHAF